MGYLCSALFIFGGVVIPLISFVVSKMSGASTSEALHDAFEDFGGGSDFDIDDPGDC